MIEAPRHDSPDVAAHLHVLMELQERSERIHQKIAEVTAKLQSQLAAESATAPQFPPDAGEAPDPSILSSLKELDAMLGQPDLITRDALRSHIKDLVHRLEEPE